MDDGPCRLLIGVDEAGYGPNLGPLVIACSSWLVREPVKKVDLQVRLESLLESLKPAFQAKAWRPTSNFVPLGDSKAIYSSGSTSDGLRFGVGYWMRKLGLPHANYEESIRSLAPSFLADLAPCAPWYSPSNPIVGVEQPRAACDEAIANEGMMITQADKSLDQAGIQLVGMTTKIVDEGAFNAGVLKHGNKASLLSYESISLAMQTIATMTSRDCERIGKSPLRSIHVYFDKHGGRNRYQAPLMQVTQECWFRVIDEGPSRSDYTTEWKGWPLATTFVAKGDRLLAPALASMTAKWLREMCMERFNRFWRAYFPELPTTAGYPVDAVRFRKAIERKAVELSIDEKLWWRSR